MASWAEDQKRVTEARREFLGEFGLRRRGSLAAARYAVRDCRVSFVDGSGDVQLVVYNVATGHDVCRCTPAELRAIVVRG